MKNPTHAVYFKDNSQGDEDLIWLFAYIINGEFYSFDSGELLIQYCGDKVLKQFELLNHDKQN